MFCIMHYTDSIQHIFFLLIFKLLNTLLQPFFQVHPGDPMLSQTRDLLELPLDFYEPSDVLSAIQTTGWAKLKYPSGKYAKS